MSSYNIEIEKEHVLEVVDAWLEGWSNKDSETILKHVSDDIIAHMPNMPSIIGHDGLEDFIQNYYLKRPLGPVTHEEYSIDVSESGDLAYEIGRHDHIVFDESGDPHVAPWNHIILLKKIKGDWKIIAISETNINPR